VSKAFDLLSEDEVRQITTLVETLDQSTFDFLQLQLGDMKLTIGKGDAPASLSASQPAVVAAPAPVAQVSAPAPGAPAPAPAAAPAAATAASAPTAPRQEAARVDDGTVAVVAPIMGRFYARPEPGAAPFVSVGSTVVADATVGLIEVMKVFNAVRAGVAGVVTEICVEDAQFIEYGQVLFRIKPSEGASK